jgi:hypothetical protein
MKIPKYVLMLFALGLVITGLNVGATWQLPQYQNAYNISVNNWNYTNGAFNSGNGCGVAKGCQSNYVLVNLTGVPQASSISVLGYSSSGVYVGVVPFYNIQSNGNMVELEIINETESGAPWNTITIYFNPVPGYSILFYGLNTGLQNNTYKSYSTNKFEIAGNFSSSPLNYFTPPWSTTNNIPQQLTNLNLTINLHTFLSTSFVVLANRSMTGEVFNETWSPDGIYLFRISGNYVTNRYNLSSLGLGGTTVTHLPVTSAHSNSVFLGNTDGTGYEGWFSTYSINSIYSEGMGVAQGITLHLYNGTPGLLFTTLGYGAPQKATQFTLTVQNYLHTSFILMPAFTTSYTISNMLVNPNSYIPSTSCANANVSNNYCFNYKLQISNIQWNYNFSSNATGNSLVTSPIWFNFSSGKVPYAILNLSYPNYYNSGWGIECSNIYIRAYSTVGGFADLGEVPYQIIGGCNGGSSTNPYVSILISNETLSSNIFNSINIYYGGETGQGVSPALKGQWQFESGNYFTTSSSQPFIINLNSQLSLYSTINLFPDSTGALIFGKSTNYYLEGSPNYITAFVTTLLSQQSFLFQMNIPGSPPGYQSGYPAYSIAASKNFDALLLYYGGFGSPGGTIVVYNTTKEGYSYGYLFSSSSFSANLFNGITATAEHLWVNVSCGARGVKCATTASNTSASTCASLGNCNFNGPPPIIPQTSNGINASTYNSPPPFNFNGIATNELTIGDTGIRIPLVAMYGLEIILLLVAFAAYEEEQEMASIAIVAVMWLIGFFNYGLFSVAIMGVLLVIVEHTVHQKHRDKGRGMGGEGGGTGYNPRRNPPVQTISGGSL